MFPVLDGIFSLVEMGSITEVSSGARWSAGEIRAQVRARLASLQQAGLAQGDVAIIAHGGTPAFFADLFSVWLAGGCAVCLNPALTTGELLNVANFVRPKLILANADQQERLRALAVAHIVLSAAIAAGTAMAGPISGPGPAAPDAPALILFTSGTTGDPKGVVHTFKTLSARLGHNRRELPGETLARTLCVLPTHFGHGLIGNCMTPLSAGCDLYLLQNPGIAGAARLAEVIDRNRITFLSSVPSFWKIVLKTSPPPTGQTLRQVSVGSAPLAGELWTQIIRWSGIDNVCNMYGITETANWTAGASAADFAPETGLVGRMWGGEAAVCTAAGVRQASGEGEILLRPPSLMTEYLRRRDLTDAVIRDGWYHTGDWGAIDGDGVIRLLGRTKTEINKAGIKILPEEVDALLEQHPSINEACAFGIPDPISGETVAAAISLKPGAEVDPAALRAWCAERIRPDGIPERWYVLPEIPKTDRGKVSRQMVKDACSAMGQTK